MFATAPGYGQPRVRGPLRGTRQRGERCTRSTARDFDPATLDVATPEHYERERLSARRVDVAAPARAGLLVRAAQRRAVLGDHQARRHHRDRQAARALPERAAPRGLHASTCRRRPRARRATCSTWIRPTTPATGASPAAGSRRAPSAAWTRRSRASRARCSTRRPRTTTGDFVRDISAPITIAVIAEMLGVPRRDWDLLFRWTNEIIAPQDPEFSARHAAARRSSSARIELFTYFNDLVAERRARPTDDIVSVVANGQVNGEPLPIGRAAVVLLPARRRRQRDDAQRHDRRHAGASSSNPGEWQKLRARRRRWSTAPSRRSCAGPRR